MSNIIHIEDFKPHEVFEAICVNCTHRWIAVAPESLWLKDIECPHCNGKGFVIKTGQIIKQNNM